jgi:osomolarity two-component system response regulator SSK1
VNFVWLERKVKEWGCMQALIDFDGWRKWKDFAAKPDNSKMSTSFASIAPKSKSKGLSPTSANAGNGNTGPTAANGVTSKPNDEKKGKRRSVGIVPPPVLPEEDSTSPPDDS